MMKISYKGTASKLVAGIVLALAATSASADKASNLDDLLKRVQQGSAQEQTEQRKRERDFNKAKQQQAKALADAKKERARQEAISKKLEAAYSANEIKIANKRQQRDERLGVLKELFGHVKGVSGDLREIIKGSLVSAQYGNRAEFIDGLIDKMGGDTELPSREELERLWAIMQQELTESGRVVKFSATVVTPDGNRTEQEVVRVGTFNIMSNGDYLQFDRETQNLKVLPRQPAGRYTSSAAALQSATSGVTPTGIDPTGPTGGSLLTALIDLPSFKERYWDQGREVGKVIIGLGAIALLISIWRFLVLMAVGAKVSSQLKNADQPKDNNPLGRVLLVGQEHKDKDPETLEMILHEAVLKEGPALEAWSSFIKITSMVAPLMGLLGTVTGMILTFQALTIFGTGDPKAMAGGISSALVTTVLGIVVAIPTIFAYSVVSGRAWKIFHILDEQTAGLIAEQSANK